jgi:hypothetical protein
METSIPFLINGITNQLQVSRSVVVMAMSEHSEIQVT